MKTLADLRGLLDRLHAKADTLDMDLLVELEDLIGRQFMDHKWTKAEKDVIRWALVREWLDQNGWSESGEHYVYASDKLRGHPAQGQPGTMKRSYDIIQQKQKQKFH